MIVSVTKLELRSYAKLFQFFKLNAAVMLDLKKSKCRKQKVTGSWHLQHFYTMSLWENENDLNEFYRHGNHLEAMKQSQHLAKKAQSKRIQADDLMTWKEAKSLFVKKD